MQRLVFFALAAIVLTACQTTSTRTPEQSQAVVSGLIAVSTASCARHFDEKKDERELVEALNKTVKEVCECMADSFYSDMSGVEVDAFLADSTKHGKEISRIEPWKSREDTAKFSCLAKSSA